MTRDTTEALEGYRFADAARTLYEFAWNEFCSFYVEMTKARFAVAERQSYIGRIRDLCKMCAEAWVAQQAETPA